MAKLFWRRVRNSTQDVLRPAEAGKARAMKVLAWFAAFGLPPAAFFNPEALLPPRPWGLILWLGAVGGALTLGVIAVYRLRAEIEVPPMAQADLEAMIRMRQLAGKTVGMFGIEDGRFDPASLEVAVTKLNVYRWTLRHHGKLAVAIGRYAEALEHVVAQAQGMPDFKRVDDAEDHLNKVCREYEASSFLAAKNNYSGRQ